MQDEELEMIRALVRAINFVYGDWTTSRDCRDSMEFTKNLATKAAEFLIDKQPKGHK